MSIQRAAAPWTGVRRAALPLTLVLLLLLPATAVRAQRLLTLVPGVGAASSADDPGPSIGPVPTAVQVDLELLRSGPAWLETPTPDGSVLWAERSVFEDRGGGDLMWSGGHPDAGYDTVVLTVEGGRLVGRFAAAGGGAYQIHAERDGRGGMAPIGGPRPLGPDGTPEPFCAVETAAEDPLHAAAHARAGAPAAEPPRRVADAQNYDRLDILVAYTATAAENWADRGGAMAAIRHAGDYLKMVFRNNELPVEPHIVHVAQASAALDRAGRTLDWHTPYEDIKPLWKRMVRDGELLRLRHEHRADFVHVFTGEHRLLLKGSCGKARQLRKDGVERFGIALSWTTNHPSSIACGDYAALFAHEIGHGLGAHHNRAHLAPGLSPDYQENLESLFTPYAMGYANFDVMPSLGTAMSYLGQVEPFFSTSRIRPWGAAAGAADEADNERTLRETVRIAARYSDSYRSLEGVPAPPSELRVRFERGSARLSWRDNAPDADVYEVDYVWTDPDTGRGKRRVLAVEGRAGATVALEYSDPGSLHKFEVRARKGKILSLSSSEVWLIVPGEPIAAPSDVSSTVDPNRDSVEVRWTDNSDNESAFDVQFLEDGEPIQRRRMGPDDERASFAWSALEPRIGAEYGVRVYAFNSSGYSEGAETSFRWEHPLDDGVVTDLAASAIGPTTVRVSWTADPEVDLYFLDAELAGWSHSVRWHPSPDARGGAAWVDFEDLPRGGRYRFEVQPSDGRSSSVYLTLGERAAGPEAPSDVSLATGADGRVRLSWKDNSSDETGFEIQFNRTRFGWRRLFTVPPDTESVVPSDYDSRWAVDVERDVFRVFAYNERGFSVASPFVAAFPGFCQADAETLCLRDSRLEVRMGWWTADGERGRGQAVDAGAKDSGLFHFFDPENWEVLIKVLDGCAINGRMWVLGASTTDLGYWIRVTDTLTGEWQRYWNEPGQPAPAIVDVKAFSRACGAAAAAGAPSEAGEGAAPGRLSASPEASAADAAHGITGEAEAGGTALRLLNRRFRATVSAVAPDGKRREGRVAPVGTDKAGLFYLFDPENWEVLFKVLDGCGINGHYWVLAASATDLGLDLRVEDTVTGKFETYGTEPGRPAPAIVDTEALACAAGAAAH